MKALFSQVFKVALSWSPKIALFCALFVLLPKILPYSPPWTVSEVRVWSHAADLLDWRDQDGYDFELPSIIGLFIPMNLIATILTYKTIMKLRRHCRS